MGHLFLVEGPVGAGKSTFALALAHEKGGPRSTLDAWMTTLFHPDSPPAGKAEWYTVRISEEIVCRRFSDNGGTGVPLAHPRRMSF